jgi:hypothetical protein
MAAGRKRTAACRLETHDLNECGIYELGDLREAKSHNFVQMRGMTF